MVLTAILNGVCTYCAADITGEETPRDPDRARPGGPVNHSWRHLTPAGDGHEPVPRGHITRRVTKVHTWLGPVEVTAVPMGVLQVGHVITGQDGTLQEVTDVRTRGGHLWVYVRDLALADQACPHCAATQHGDCQYCGGTREQGHGFYTYPDTTPMLLVTGGPPDLVR
jgi:hypothetical protein